jgi:thioredoxin-like negative regulator of GroEL
MDEEQKILLQIIHDELGWPNDEVRKRLLENHKQMLDSLDKEAKGRFASALIEAGILSNWL